MVAGLVIHRPAWTDDAPVGPTLSFSIERPTDFVHRKGGSGKRFLVETMGPGLALFDYDLDGDLDLYLVQGAPLPGAKPFDSRNRMLVNDGAGRFRDTTSETTAPDVGYGMGCATGDIDNDGDLDLYVTNFGANVLYRNDGGKFVDVTEVAGVGDPAWGSSAAFADFDADGKLDLYVANYLDFTIERHKECTLGKGIPAYCSPDAYPGVTDRIYRNLGGGRFEDVTARVGLAKFLGKSLGVVCADFDGDGRSDIYIANDGVANQVLMNRGDWKFEDTTLLAGVGYNDDGMAQAGMGIAVGDLDGDRQLDLFVTNLSGETNVLYRSLEPGYFEDATAWSRVGPAGFLSTGFGTNAEDFDADGDLDLFVANGHVIDNIAQFNDHQVYRQPDQLFQNNGSGRFSVATDALGKQTPGAGRGSAVGDVDGDGDLDIVVSQCEGPTLLYRNTTERGGHWLRIDFRGRASNRDGIGVKVVAKVGDRTLYREVIGGGSYLTATAPIAHLGLGRASQVDRLEVAWPSGRKQTLEAVSANRVLRLTEPEEK